MYSTYIQKIETNKIGKILTIAIDNPSKRNAIDSDMAKAISQSIEFLEDSKDYSAGVLYGRGGNFSSGFDLANISKDELSYFDWNDKGNSPIGPCRRNFKKPIIAAINGYCVGGAFELALACDVRIMEKSAILGIFNRRFGIPVMNGGIVRLLKMVGLSRTLDIVISGRKICSDEAYQMGLISKIVPDTVALSDAMIYALKLCNLPQKALKHDRNVIYNLAYANMSQVDQFKSECKGAFEIMKQEGSLGARKFDEGCGRKGQNIGTKSKLDDSLLKKIK
ncbi:Enoyl-CoA hydratase domain-containing protein 3, mitochondrial [Intoshia linei]|uniref:Enoyl-CoA hydratase domain-containing protein 3, mitochondrial n=1 Tax=Intoshia linei TaxID=1819745 RepID=A0A177B2Y3_9BILA|nr:Enoyl-CoA hydratase domain-containing protein 3, mitochondrial [Intoshia linei]